LLDGLLVKPLTSSMFAKALEVALSGAGASRTVADSKPRRLEGMRVLLVEDNAINQQVAQELLAAEGALIELADNGALGLEALRNAPVPFNVVLMDLQMPVMDGLTATRQLRQDPRFNQLPVIAMTANAMGSDREECLQAGMNDHVGKPFDLNQLVFTLVSHTHWSGSTDVPQASAAVAETAPRTPATIDVPLALSRMGGNAALLQRSVAAYASDARVLPARLLQAVLNTDPSGFKRELHAFKGLSATVGANILSQIAAQMERNCQSQPGAADQIQTVAELQESIDKHLPELEAAVAALLPPQPQPAEAAVPTSMSSVAFVEQLTTLLTALHASDMGAMELYAALRQNFGDNFAEPLQALDTAMADLDFAAAAQACEQCLAGLGTPFQHN
jgi:CheY-like chemotaxis protein